MADTSIATNTTWLKHGHLLTNRLQAIAKVGAGSGWLNKSFPYIATDHVLPSSTLLIEDKASNARAALPQPLRDYRLLRIVIGAIELRLHFILLLDFVRQLLQKIIRAFDVTLRDDASASAHHELRNLVADGSDTRHSRHITGIVTRTIRSPRPLLYLSEDLLLQQLGKIIFILRT